MLILWKDETILEGGFANLRKFKQVLEMAIEEISYCCGDKWVKQKTVEVYYETFEKYHEIKIDTRKSHCNVKIEKIDVI